MVFPQLGLLMREHAHRHQRGFILKFIFTHLRYESLRWEYTLDGMLVDQRHAHTFTDWRFVLDKLKHVYGRCEETGEPRGNPDRQPLHQ